MRRYLVMGLLVVGLLLTASSAAFAIHSSDDSVEKLRRTGWEKASNSSKGCQYCHAAQTQHTSGPHGGYQATTDKCMACHTVHNAENEALLPGTTVTGTCNFCHDLTQTEVAPYFISYLATETEIKAAHQVEGLDIEEGSLGPWDGSISIPGGDPSTGNARNLDTSGQGKLSGSTKFTCDSCHTPHAIADTTVEPFLGESQLKFTVNANGDAGRFWLTDRLLKAKLNGSAGFIYKKYNSDWCAACHLGRYKNGAIHNHPVSMAGTAPNSDAAADTTDAEGYKFLDYLTAGNFENGASKDWLIDNAKTNGKYNTFYWAEDGSSALTTNGSGEDIVDLGTFGSGLRMLNKDPRTNKQYAMTAGDPIDSVTPNKSRPDGYMPIGNYPDGPSCQQCHGNARDVEKPFLESLEDGNNGYAVMSFPHVSKNEALIVESGDDFCTNCHGLDNLP